MAVEERQRHELHARLEQLLGPEEASTLMSYLPPVGWADVATKRDLDHFADRLRIEFHDALNRALNEGLGALRRDLGLRVDGLDGRIDGLDGRIDGLDGRIDKLDGRIDKLDGRIDKLDDKLDANLRVLLFSMLGAIFTTAGLAFGAAHL